MQSGGPITFYEIAATLIPVLFLGGVLLDNMHPPDPGKLKKEESTRQHIVLFGVVVYYLPVAGLFVIFAEAVALDAVVSRTADSFHALLVGLTLIAGMVAVVAAVWVPWVLKFGSWAKQELYLSPRVILGSAVIGLLSFLVALALQPWATSPFSELLRNVETPPQREETRRYASQITWLEHLIATSGYRVDRLQDEKEHATGEAARLRIDKHLRLQRRTQQRQYEAIKAVEDGIAEPH
jgi:Nitrate reductase gamma subunit